MNWLYWASVPASKLLVELRSNHLLQMESCFPPSPHGAHFTPLCVLIMSVSIFPSRGVTDRVCLIPLKFPKTFYHSPAHFHSYTHTVSWLLLQEPRLAHTPGPLHCVPLCVLKTLSLQSACGSHALTWCRCASPEVKC